MGVMQQLNRVMGERMASSGRMAMIETVGRKSGNRFRTPVGYVRHDDGSVWLGAGRAEAQWPKNLLAMPRCRAKIGGTELDYTAIVLEGDERASAVEAIHAKYGAPASRVGTGPVFVLRPVSLDAAGDAAADGPGRRDDAVA